MRIDIIPTHDSSSLCFLARLTTDDGKEMTTKRNRHTPGAAIGDLVVEYPELFNVKEIGIPKAVLER